MAVTMPRETWTDQRLDDLSNKVGEGFARVDKDLREMRAEIKDLRKEMKSENSSLRGEMRSENSGLRDEMKAEISSFRGEVKADISELNARFDALQRTLIGGVVAIVVALIGSSVL